MEISTFIILISFFLLALLIAVLFLKATFKTLALKTLQENQKYFLDLAENKFSQLRTENQADIEAKKEAIEKQLSYLNKELESFKTNTTELKTNIHLSREQITNLTKTTHSLNNVLSNNQARGQWGERQAEDLLRHFGLKEGINYDMQTSESGNRPDFSFYLPKGKRLNMDIKYPISAYQSYLEAESKSEKDSFLKQFISDIKTHIKDVSKRGYINPADGTLDFCILFISNEGIYNFINKQKELTDLASDHNLVFCGPTSLFAILSMIRQSIQSFMIEEEAKNFQSDLNRFKSEWSKYKEKILSVETKLEQASKALHEAETTRSKALERPLSKLLDYDFNSKDS
jgi:DNA recombination protein RmuC